MDAPELQIDNLFDASAYSPELQKDDPFAASRYVAEPPEDFPFATPRYVMELLKDFPFATPKHVTELLEACPYASQQDVVSELIASGSHFRNRFLSADQEVRKSYLLHAHDWLRSSIHHINRFREIEEENGREHVKAGPLLHVHSVHVQPKKTLQTQELAVFGTIRVSFQNIMGSEEPMQLDVYNQSAEEAESISSSGGYLTLGWPCRIMWTNLQESTIAVDLYLKIGDEVVPFAKEDILVGGTTEGNFEELISKEFHHEDCSATLTYIAMPFAVLCQVGVRFNGKDLDGVVNVAGKIVARYKNTYGNYNSEPCVLFEKQNDYEPVRMNTKLRMPRAWLGMPAYSSLELDLDLRDVDTNRKFGRRVELFNGNGLHTGAYREAVDDFVISVDAMLIPYPLNAHTEWSEFDELLDYSHPKLGFELSSSNNGNTWCHDLGQARKPQPLLFVEFHSIFIGCKKMGGLKIFGTVEISRDGNTHYLFKSSCNDGVEVEAQQKVLPLKDGCMTFDEYDTLELKVNLQDVCGKFANRGFGRYTLVTPFPSSCFNTRKCFVFPGKDGFCALHYSLFQRACKANIQIIFKIKRSSHSGVERIYGSAITRFSNFDYSTKFKRDYFRSVLFRSTEKDPVQLNDDGEVPLSRNVVAVPMDSSLIIEVDFCGVSLKDNLLCMQTFKFGHPYFVKETKDYKLEIKLIWSDRWHNGWIQVDKDKGCRMGGTNQTRTSIKRQQPDQRNGGSDLDEDEDCRMSGVNQMNTSVKIMQPGHHNTSSKSNPISTMDVAIVNENEVLPFDYAFGSVATAMNTQPF